MSRRALSNRLDRLERRLAPQGDLSIAEARELAALQEEFDGQPAFELMDSAALDAWFREWGCGTKGARLDELRQRARTPKERCADQERVAVIAKMSPAELDEWLTAYTGGNPAGSGS